jgi:hypothetical protein
MVIAWKKWMAGSVLFCAAILRGETFQLPTANRALLQPGQEEQYFVGTTGKPWTSGTFGCVRSEGHQMHEGIDVRCQKR